MTLRLTKRTSPATPATNKSELFFDTLDNRLKNLDYNGILQVLTNSIVKRNYIMNGGMSIQQRIAVASTAIASVSTTTRAGVVADRWAVTTSVASNLNWQQVDTNGVAESGLAARFYGSIISATAGKKVMISQFIINREMQALHGKKVRLQVNIKQKVGSAQTYKLGLLQLTAAGTTDTCPAFLTGAWSTTTGVDPSWGTNLSPITPDASPVGDGGTITGNFLNITTTSGWVRASVVFTVPSDCKNLIPVLFADATGGTTDNLSISEFGLYVGVEILDWFEEEFTYQLAKCQAYFCKTNPYATVPAVGLAANSGEAKGVAGKAGAVANAGFIYWRFPVEMWKTPVTVTLFGVTTTTLVRDETASVDHSSSVVAGSTTSSTRVTSTGNASTAVGDEIGLHITADSETVN